MRDRPGTSSSRACSYSSLRVGASPRWTAADSLPSAVRVRLGRFLSVCLLLAADCAFFTLRFAACRCFCDGHKQYVEAFLRNVNWDHVNRQLAQAEAAKQGADATGLQEPSVAGR
jgi:hypothetical protein